jgi:WD40 repeat protein
VIELRDGRLASGSDDRSVRVWDLSTGQPLLVLQGHSKASPCLPLLVLILSQGVSCVAELRDGLLASGSRDSSVRLWDLSSGTSTPLAVGSVSDPDGRVSV